MMTLSCQGRLDGPSNCVISPTIMLRDEYYRFNSIFSSYGLPTGIASTGLLNLAVTGRREK
jgi:hypothetical protein